MDHTGIGNTLNMHHPHVLQLLITLHVSGR